MSAGSHAQQQPHRKLNSTRRPHYSAYSGRPFRAMENTGSADAAAAAGGGSDGGCSGGGKDTPLFVYGTLMNEQASDPPANMPQSVDGVLVSKRVTKLSRHAPPRPAAAEV